MTKLIDKINDSISKHKDIEITFKDNEKLVLNKDVNFEIEHINNAETIKIIDGNNEKYYLLSDMKTIEIYDEPDAY